MSVRIVSFNSALILARMRNPSVKPGPRNDLTEERFALSYDALKMYGAPASAAILATRSAIIRAWASLSITHGPAIRNSGRSPGYGGRPISRLNCCDISTEDSTRKACADGEVRPRRQALPAKRALADCPPANACFRQFRPLRRFRHSPILGALFCFPARLR